MDKEKERNNKIIVRPISSLKQKFKNNFITRNDIIPNEKEPNESISEIEEEEDISNKSPDSSNLEIENNDNLCCFCKSKLENIIDDQNMIKLHCSHNSHSECLQKVMGNSLNKSCNLSNIICPIHESTIPYYILEKVDKEAALNLNIMYKTMLESKKVNNI